MLKNLEAPLLLRPSTSDNRRSRKYAFRKYGHLHRADLTALERKKQIAEWVRLTEQKAQVAPIESKRADGRGHRKKGGINAAVRELGIDRTEAQRAVR
jgi:hypothetical protein